MTPDELRAFAHDLNYSGLSDAVNALMDAANEIERLRAILETAATKPCRWVHNPADSPCLDGDEDYCAPCWAREVLTDV